MTVIRKAFAENFALREENLKTIIQKHKEQIFVENLDKGTYERLLEEFEHTGDHKSLSHLKLFVCLVLTLGKLNWLLGERSGLYIGFERYESERSLFASAL